MCYTGVHDEEFIHSVIHSFPRLICIVYPFCVWYCSVFWGHSSEKDVHSLLFPPHQAGVGTQDGGQNALSNSVCLCHTQVTFLSKTKANTVDMSHKHRLGWSLHSQHQLSQKRTQGHVGEPDALGTVALPLAHMVPGANYKQGLLKTSAGKPSQ